MQTWKTRFRRIAAMVCALALCASLLPAGALANNTDSNESPSSQVVTATEPAEEEKTEETGTETEQPAAETEQPAEETETEEKVEEETEEPAEEPEEEPVEEPEEEPAETVGDGTGEEEDDQPAVNSVILQADNSEPSVEARVADGTETVYTDDDKGISVTAEVGYTGALTRRSVEFIITIDGAEAGRKTIDNFDVWGQNVTIIAPGYQVATRIEGSELVTGTFTHTSGDIYRLIPTANNLTAYIELTSFKTSDTVQIGDYGTFSWEKGDAENDDFERQLTIYVDGEERETFAVYTPDLLTNAGTNDQFWFTPDTDTYNSDVRFQVGGDGTGLTLGSTLGLIDFSVYLTTKCPCGNAWCECPGGSECTCEPDCDCDLCNPEQGATEIRTNYGVIEYKEPSGEGYNLTVEVYVNGQLKETTDQLRVRAGELDCLNFTPADGYYYFNDQNSYDLVTDGSSTWDQRTGYLLIVGGRDDNNVLKIYLWTFKNHARLDVERRLGDVMDNVTGYMISYEAYNPETKQNETFTYEATSFLLAQSQMVPTDTNVTLTPICDAPYEVSQWSTAGAYTAVTLTGSEGQSQTEAYGNQATINIHNTAFTSVTVYIDSLRGVTPPTEDDLTGNKDNIFDNGVAVIVDCVNDEVSHEEANYGLTAGSFEISELKGDSVSGYYVEVTVTPDSYVDRYNDKFTDDVTHERTDESDKVIRLNWVVVQNENGSYTSAWKAVEPATIKVTCGGVEVPTKPDEPTITEIDDLLDVKVTCANNVPTHKETIYSVNYYTLGEVTSSDNGNTYTCVVTIPSANYIVDFNDASGMQHTCATESEEVTLVATKVDNVWKWQLGSGEKSMVEFQATCKPDDPTDDEIKILFGDTTLQVKCINESASHDAHTFALQDETFEVASVDFENGTYIATVNIAKAPYRDLYNEEVGTVHSLVDDTTVVTATLLYNGNEWVLPENATVTIDVTCDTTTDPGTDKPDEPTAEELTDAFGSKILVLCNQKNPNHYRGLRGAYYWLNQGNFSFTEVRQDADNGYYVEVTVEPGRYVELFSQATGVNHTLVSGQGNQTFRMYYTKGVWTPDVQQVTFNVTCSWTTVSGGDTPKDEHPEVGKAIANGTWGTPTPTPAASATSTIPQTSDSMPIGLLAGTAAIAAAAIALLLVLRKRRQQ